MTADNDTRHMTSFYNETLLSHSSQMLEAPRGGGGSEAHFRHTLEPWKLSAALPQYHRQTGLTEKGLHEACIAENLGSLKQPLRRPPARIPGGGAWTPRGGVDSSRVIQIPLRRICQVALRNILLVRARRISLIRIPLRGIRQVAQRS